MTIETSDGEKFDVLVTAKTNLLIKGRGDAGFFKHANVFVSAEDIVMNAGNKYLFGKKFVIHLGNKPPAERFEPDPTNPSLYHIAGPVVDCAEDSFTFEAGGTPYKVGFEQGVVPEISVESTEPEHAAVGAAVELDGATRGGKFVPSAISVTLDKAMVADEVFAGSDKKSAKSKHAASSKTTKKASKTDKDKGDKTADKGDDAANSDPFKKPTSDPFATDKDKKDPKKAKPAPKKDKKPAANNADSDN